MNIPRQERYFEIAGAAVLLLLASLLLSPGAIAATAGKVVVAKGSVYAKMAGKQRELQRRAPVEEKETVATGDGSRTQLRFVDGALLTLNENSELMITEYSYKAAGKPDKVLLRLAKGGFRTVTGAIGKTNKEAYLVETPLASIGIRGTSYSVTISPDGSFATIVVHEGTVTISNDQGDITIGAGQEYKAAIVYLGEPPQGLDTDLLNPVGQTNVESKKKQHVDDTGVHPGHDTGKGDQNFLFNIEASP